VGCSCMGGEAAFVVPTGRAPAGDALLGLAPAGADAVLEVDLARVRRNPAVGQLARAVSPPSAEPGGAAAIAAVDALLVLSYGLGEGAPRMLILGRGGDALRLAGAAPLGGGAVALGDAALVRRDEPALAADRELQALRAWSMPAAAEAAAVRLTARLSFEARLGLARRLSLDAVPRTISLWADVVDDLALIALLGADRPRDTSDLERGSQKLVARLAQSAPLFGRPLARELGKTRVEARGALVRFTLVIGPRRLAQLVSGALRSLDAATPIPAPEGT
jgi:hypothetical protein